MIEINEETRKAMIEMGVCLEKHLGQTLKKRRGFDRQGNKVKLYACRSGKGGRQVQHFYHSDSKTIKNLKWINDVLEAVLNIKVSRSVLIRRAIVAYQKELLELLTSHTGHTQRDLAVFLNKLAAEKEALYECANMRIED